VAEFNPPGWLQNAGATHTAVQMRNYIAGLAGGASASAALTGRGGVNISLGNKLVVTQTGSPSMAVIVRSGVAWVPGTEAGSQGSYGVLNDADVTLSISAAHPTLPRIDIVAFKVQDTQYSGAVNSCSLVVVTGTAAGSPSAPAAPANSIVLANVAVAAAATSITNANITDKRTWLTGAGGIMVCTSGTRPAAGTVGAGQVIYESDTTFIYRTDDGGTTWTKLPFKYTASQVLGASAASVTFSGIPTNLKKLSIRFTARCDVVTTFQSMSIKINNDGGANYNSQTLQGSGSTAASSLISASTNGFIGLIPASTAAAGQFAGGQIEIEGWDSPHTNYLSMQSMTILTGTVNAADIGGVQYTQAGPYNRIDFIPQAGNFIAGSAFYLTGEYE